VGAFLRHSVGGSHNRECVCAQWFTKLALQCQTN